MNLKQPIKPKDGLLASYLILAIVRVIFVFIPQTGYIHPDEFFQSVEVMAGDEYGLEVVRTWEFNSTFPIRSVAIPYFGIRIPLNFMRFVSMYTKYYVDMDLRNSYFLLVFPRFLMCIVSFLNDWSLYKICLSYGLAYQFRLLTLASSYVILVYGIRTFTNTIEMAICSLLLYIVSDCMIHSNTVIFQKEFLDNKYKKAARIVDKVRFHKLRLSLPSHSFNKCILMSTLCVAGSFNRPTFILFGLPLVFHWLLRGMGSKTVSFLDFNLRIGFFIASAIPSLIFFIIVDSFYFGYLTIPEIEKFDFGIDNFIVTPLNFIRYNINPENTKEHGEHSYFLHLLINFPLLYNILGIAAIFSIGMMAYRLGAKQYAYLPRAQSFVGLMLSAIVFPLVGLSFINHQEPRFLIPITLPVILLYSPKLQTGFCSSYPFRHHNLFKEYLYRKLLCTKASAKYLMKIWYTVNILLTIFYGFVHQGSVVQLADHFSQFMQIRSNTLQVHLITSHIYMMPQSLLMLPSTKTLHTNPDTGHKYRRNKQFFVYEYGSLDLDELYRKVKLILDINEMRTASTNQKYHLYLAIPSSLSEDLNNVFYKKTSAALMKRSVVKTFYPHISTEAMPKLFSQHMCGINIDVGEIDQTCSIYEYEDVQNPYSISRAIREFSSVMHQFGLILYRIELRKKIQ